MKINSKKYNKKLSSSKQGNSKKNWNEFDALSDEFFEEIEKLKDENIVIFDEIDGIKNRLYSLSKKLNEK
tara:strand:+ start:342 stop:551 length:210 start_codon:yes stop_codon:yes gene_type:complete